MDRIVLASKNEWLVNICTLVEFQEQRMNSITPQVGRATMAGLADDILIAILGWAGNRATKQLGQTRREFRAITRRYEDTKLYAVYLARSAADFFIAHVVSKHGRCTGDIEVKAAAHAALTAANLAGRQPSSLKPFPTWGGGDLLRLLYPTAMCMERWADAPYALEWCARQERTLLGGGLAPRGEILAILHSNALSQLAAHAERGGRPTGHTLANEVDSVCTAIINYQTFKDARSSVASIARTMMLEVKIGGDGIFMAAVIAAAEARLEGPYSAGLCITKLREALRLISDIAFPEDRAWLHLVGLGGRQSLESMLDAYHCRGD